MRIQTSQRLVLGLFASIALMAGVASAHEGKHDKPDPAHAAAGATESFGQPGQASKVRRTVVITMTDAMRFTPSSLSVGLGDTLRLHIVNTGKLPHEFVLGTKAEIDEHAQMMRQMPEMVHSDPGSARVAPGKSVDLVWQFSKRGQFFYACLVPGHREAGMLGQLSVSGSVKK
jgi:uncharacterized cupredoxin-like copper-binding protein